MDLTSKEIFVRSQHLAQLFLSTYGLSISFIAITKLRKYEETTKKLAEWSSEVGHQLHKTRTTQASGFIAISASFVASATLAFIPTFFPGWVRLTLSPALLAGVLLARAHIKNYWVTKDGTTVGPKVPLPKMGDYNDAQRMTQNLLEVLQYLEYSWIAASLVNAVVRH